MNRARRLLRKARAAAGSAVFVFFAVALSVANLFFVLLLVMLGGGRK